MNQTYEYDVVLSFAGENRNYVEQVANALKQQNIKVFYDEYEKVNLWGKNLIDHLDDIYRFKGRYCVLFISKFYALKAWPTQERRSAQARAFQSSQEYILPARFDATEIPGVHPTVGYIDLNKYNADKFAELIVAKLKGENISKPIPLISHHSVRLEFIFDTFPNLNATLSEIEDTALQSMLQITTNDYGRQISFPYSLRGGFYERTSDRILYQIDHKTGFSNFKIQDNLSLNSNGKLESIQIYRWEQEKDTLFELDMAVRHSVYLFNFVCRWLTGLSTLLNHQWDSTTVKINATMPNNTILFDNNGFIETEMEIARFMAHTETASGSIVLGKNVCLSQQDLAKQMGRLLNFVLNSFEYSSFGKRKFTKITDDVIIKANKYLMAKVT